MYPSNLAINVKCQVTVKFPDFFSQSTVMALLFSSSEVVVAKATLQPLPIDTSTRPSSKYTYLTLLPGISATSMISR